MWTRRCPPHPHVFPVNFQSLFPPARQSKEILDHLLSQAGLCPTLRPFVTLAFSPMAGCTLLGFPLLQPARRPALLPLSLCPAVRGGLPECPVHSRCCSGSVLAL